MAERITLESLEARVRNLENSRPAQRVKLHVPQPCQRSIRAVLEQLKKATDDPLHLTYDRKADDEEAMRRVVKETRRLFADQGWAVGTCEEAFWRVWANKRDDLRRKQSGKAEAHRLSARNNKRIRNKLESRKKALSTINWPERRKQRMLSALRTDCTSPVVSDEEDDNLLLSVRLSWESPKLSGYKRQLDSRRVFNAPARGKNKMKKWARHETLTKECQPPENAPSWAVGQQLDVTLEYEFFPEPHIHNHNIYIYCEILNL